jgi:hypothetical protein
MLVVSILLNRLPTDDDKRKLGAELTFRHVQLSKPTARTLEHDSDSMLGRESDREISLLTRLPWWIVTSRKLQEGRLGR